MTAIQLRQEILSCTQCQHDLPFPPKPVLQWQPKARILIAGQAPGIRVHETGLPFNDPSGDRLREWLSVSREQFYDDSLFAIVPMAFCYPGTGKSGDLPPPKICAQLWRGKLLEAMPDIHLTLAIGAYAQRYHFPEHKGSLTDLLKCYLREPEAYDGCIPLPHPSPRNNIWLKKNPWFEQDLLPLLKRKMKVLLP